MMNTEINEVLNNGGTSQQAPTSDAGKSPSDVASQKAKIMALMGGGSIGSPTNSQGLLAGLAGGNANGSAGGSALQLGIGVGTLGSPNLSTVGAQQMIPGMAHTEHNMPSRAHYQMVPMDAI